MKPKRVGEWENLGTSLVDLPAEESGWRWANGDDERRGGRLPFGRRGARILRSSALSLFFLLGVGAVLAIEAFSELVLPPVVRSPRTLVLLAATGVFFAVETYLGAVRSLGFYRRFINPGLRHLIEVKGDSLFRGEKLFRGRRTVLMKIDIAGFTQATFGMPYGMRRLFLDLWFTLIDHVVARNVFLDKSLGDGSLYCFDYPLPGGSCLVALEAALNIRDRHVMRFDHLFDSLLRERLAEQPELKVAADRFFAGYRERMGADFWDRRTSVRIALAAGFVDEGLWGLSSKSHYDVQGSLPILVTRLEGVAGDGEIVFDRGFLDQLEDESPGRLDRSVLHERAVDLKGIGETPLFAVAPWIDPLAPTPPGS